jgi:DNA-binding cell septation regulator SpoVG
MDDLRITNVRFTAASSEDLETGLLGWASCTLNDTLRLDGLTLRRTADQRLTLSFPARLDARGRQHFFVRPIDNISRREIEAQIFRALAIEEGA